MKRLRERETRKKQSCVFLVLLFERKQLTAGKRRERELWALLGRSAGERRVRPFLFFLDFFSCEKRAKKKGRESY
jgi:hypothetical protein